VTVALSIVPMRATCPGFTLDDQYAQNSAVFVGRVIAQRVVGIAPDRRETETTFELETLWKGEEHSTLQVRTCGWRDGNEAVTCSEGITFVVGSRYVVFANGAPLRTSGCRPTSPVDQAALTLRWLSEETHKKIS
jgi:hypothetical protein